MPCSITVLRSQACSDFTAFQILGTLLEDLQAEKEAFL